ncbi:CdaR family protein [Aminobacterium sp. MB27-C1]|uniref:CdaR family protein n=1 Tax=Aminobacterium sp. MB27-C1 TaxID=3070661 RepID=UPI001BCAEF67|nr:CdaR family protein [Aminobacterium sp. MB27-C1]WMI70511.1 CdaR family protein [Aminobacterium sp. MB27-C1]
MTPGNRKIDVLLSSPHFLRIISIVIAVLLWFYVSGDRANEIVKTFRCQVDFLNVPSQTILKPETKTVEVSVSGSRRVLDSLQQGSILCEVDTKGLSLGKYRLAVRAIVPKDVKVVGINPSQIALEMIRYVDRLVPVEVVVKEGLPSGIYLESVHIMPKDVTVKGIEKDLARIESVRISPTLEQLKSGEEITLPVEIVKSQPFEDEVTIDPGQIKVTAVLAQGLPKKKVPVNVQVIGEPDSDYSVKAIVVEPSEVEVEGPYPRLGKVTRLETETIDITGLAQEQSMIVPLKPLDDSLLKYTGASSVRVNILLKPYTVSKLLTNVGVEVEGNSIYPGWSVEPNTVNITIEGIPSEIEKISETDFPIQPYVNVTNIVSRKLMVPVQIRNTSSSIRVVKVDPSRVTVRAEVE